MAKRKSKSNANNQVVLFKPQQATKAKRKRGKRQQSVGRLGVLLRNLGGLGGNALSSAVPALGALGVNGRNGWNLGASLSRWLGSGDYQLSSNSLVSAAKSGQLAGMHSNSQSITVRHKEYIGDVITSGTPGAFQSQIYSLNPGTQTFPWLSILAPNFQEYQWRGLVFEYKSTSATGIASTTNIAMGSVMMATQYRASAAPFISKLAMLEEFFSSDGKNYEDFCHPIECNPRENQNRVFYIRRDAVPLGEDIKTFDLGTFTIATQGFPGVSQNVGELWATYEVDLIKPQLLPGLSTSVLPYLHIWSSSAITAANPWGNPYVVINNSLSAAVTTTSITFPPGALSGNYNFSWALKTNGSALGESFYGITSTSVGVTLLTLWGNNVGANSVPNTVSNTSVYTVPGGGVNSWVCINNAFNIVATPGVPIVFNVVAGSVIANMTSSDLIMVKVPDTAY